MTESLRRFEAMPAAEGFGTVQPTPTLDQRHLRGEVIALQHLDGLVATAEAHVISASIGTRAHQPAAVVHPPQQRFSKFCRTTRIAVGPTPKSSQRSDTTEARIQINSISIYSQDKKPRYFILRNIKVDQTRSSGIKTSQRYFSYGIDQR